MHINTSKENHFRPANFDLYSQNQLLSTLANWLKEHKKNRKQPIWNSFIFTLATLLMPDVEMNQLLISHDFFIEKLCYLLGLCNFRTQTLFNGVQIKLIETFIAFDTSCRLQKVIIQGTQIKQVTPTQSFTMIKREDLTCEDRKQKMFIYNRQKSKNTTFLTVELKVLQRTKNDLFKQDHSNKMKFFTNFVFGDYCPSFCVSGINMIEIKENQWLKQKAHLHSANIYLIYSGTFVCFLENTDSKSQENAQRVNDTPLDTRNHSRQISAQKSRRGLSTACSRSHAQDFISKIQLNKGSIIQSSSFKEILTKTNQLSTHRFQNCKAISNSVIFQIKCSQFYRALCADERCMEYFLNQYEKVLLSRKLMISKSLSTLNKFFMQNEQQSNQIEYNFGIQRRKNYKGFRTSRSSKSNFQDIQSLATVGIYDTMIRNKQKVLSLQKEYKQRNKSTGQKSNYRYEDNKKMKENYKRMKIKDYQIQKLVFRNSVSNIIDPNVIKNMKSRFGQVKGMFEDEIEEVQTVIKQQRKAMLEVEMNKQNNNFKRRGMRLKSYSPQTSKSSYNKHSLSYSKTCMKSKRISLNQNFTQDIFNQTLGENTRNNFNYTDPLMITKSTTALDPKRTMKNLPSTYDLVINRSAELKNYLQNPLKCVNETQRDIKRTGKKVKTFLKKPKRVSNLKPNFNHTVTYSNSLTID